jgi:hypothetical protein
MITSGSIGVGPTIAKLFAVECSPAWKNEIIVRLFHDHYGASADASENQKADVVRHHKTSVENRLGYHIGRLGGKPR